KVVTVGPFSSKCLDDAPMQQVGGIRAARLGVGGPHRVQGGAVVEEHKCPGKRPALTASDENAGVGGTKRREHREVALRRMRAKTFPLAGFEENLIQLVEVTDGPFRFIACA